MAATAPCESPPSRRAPVLPRAVGTASSLTELLGVGTVVSSAGGVMVGMGGRDAEEEVEETVEGDEVVDRDDGVGVLVGSADKVVLTVTVIGTPVVTTWGGIEEALETRECQVEKRGRSFVK